MSAIKNFLVAESASSSQSSTGNATRRDNSGDSRTTFAPDFNLQHQQQHQVTVVVELRGSRREQFVSGVSRLSSLGQVSVDADDSTVPDTMTLTTSHHQQRRLRNGGSAGMDIGYSDGRTCGGGVRSDIEWSENKSSLVSCMRTSNLFRQTIIHLKRFAMASVQLDHWEVRGQWPLIFRLNFEITPFSLQRLTYIIVHEA